MYPRRLILIRTEGIGLATMGKKNRAKIKLESKETKVKRAEELRALFDAPNTVANSTVAKTPTQTSLTPTATATLKTGSHGSLYQTNSFSGTERRSVPRELPTVIHSSTYKPATRLDLRKDDRERATAWWLGPVLLAGVVFMVGVAWFHVEKSLNRDASAKKVARPAVTAQQPNTAPVEAGVTGEDRSRVEYYRRELGHRLNSNRVAVELQNYNKAPLLDSNAHPIKERTMTSGVPLMPEGYGIKSSRDRLEPVHPDHPDARIMYGLQDEQDRDGWQRLADQTYVKEFVENARRDGYNVKVDADFNVISVEPLFDNARGPGSLPRSGR